MIGSGLLIHEADSNNINSELVLFGTTKKNIKKLSGKYDGKMPGHVINKNVFMSEET